MLRLMAIAIITGASSGIGEEFAKRIDDRGLDCIWLIARRNDRLEKLSQELKTECRIFTVDLTDRSQLDQFTDTIRSEAPDIGYLINCAGFGKFGLTWEIPQEMTRSMIDLNVTALVQITNACIPFMKQGSKIIQLDSLSAYIPMYDLNVYASTKAFVKHYCNALRKELKPLAISVTEVSPGWVRTEFISISISENQVPEKVFRGAITKEQVVEKAIKAADKGRSKSICGWKNWAISILATHFPNFASRMWRGYFH